MKIVVTGLRGFPRIQGGVETHCEELCPRLVKLGCDMTVTRRKPFVREASPLTVYEGVKFKDLNTPKRQGLEAAVHTFRSVWYAFRTHHGPDYDRRKWGRLAKFVLRFGEFCVARWADEVIVISTVIQNLLKTKYHRENTHLIYNGVNPPSTPINETDYIRQLGLKPRKYLLAVGRFVEEKNFDKLILAYAKTTYASDYRLVIAGDADHENHYSKSLKAIAKKHHVILTGMIKGNPLQQLYAHAALFVLPSSHEGLPFTLLEAMSYQIPVLVSDIPANKAVNLPSDCYFHYSKNGILALSEAIEKKLENPVSHTYDLTSYNWEHIAWQTYNVYLMLSEYPLSHR